MTPTKINPPGDPDKPEDLQSLLKKDRTTAPMADDSRKRRFSEALEPTTDKKAKTTKPVTNSDDEDEKISPLELAAQAQAKIREAKAKPTITGTAVFHKEVTDRPLDSLVVAENDDSPALCSPEELGQMDSKSAQKKAEASQDTTATIASTQPSTSQSISVVKEEAKTAKSSSDQQKNTSSDQGFTQSNLAFVPAPVVYAVANAEATKMADKVSSARETLMQLAAAMLEKIQQVKAADRTETTVTLKHPPMFAGVEMKLTEFNSSQKQFNVEFSNINNPEARALLAQADNQAKLQQALLEKGYTLQMITVDHKVDTSPAVEKADVALGQKATEDEQANSATDTDDGDVT